MPQDGIDWEAETTDLPLVDESKLAKKQPGRAFAQGITFGFADELEAYLKTIGDDSEEYQQVLGEIRDNMKAYQKAHPVQAGTFEMAGAIAPALISLVASGGASLGLLGARIGKQYPGILNAVSKVVGTKSANTVLGTTAVSAAQGGITGAGKAEGDFAQTMTDATMGTGSGAAIGGGLGVVGFVGSKIVSQVIDFARRQFGEKAAGAAQRELQKLAQERGITPDEAYEMIANGQLLAENKTLRDVVRTYRAQGGMAAETLRSGLQNRPTYTQGGVKKFINEKLGLNLEENVLTKRLDDLTDLKAKAEKLYDSPMGRTQVPQPLLLEMVKVFQDAPETFAKLKRAFRTGGRNFPFELRNGQIIVKPNKSGEAIITVSDAEILRRSLRDTANKFYKDGEGEVYKNINNMRYKIEALIDGISPDTKLARETYHKMKNVDEAFKTGQDNWTANPNVDKLRQEYGHILAKGQEELEAFRLGVLSKIRQQLGSGSRASTIKKMADPETNLGMAIRDIFPEQDINQLIQKLSNATDANEAAQEILKGSGTAITNALVKREGTSADIIDAMGNAGFSAGVFRVVHNIMKKYDPGLSDSERNDLVQLMLSRDGDKIKRIISDEARYDLLEDKIIDLGKNIKSAFSRAGTQTIEPETLIAAPGMIGAGQ